MKVVCISGKARHGKDTVANFMEEYLASKGYKVLITHYGDLVKYICKAFFGWNEEKDEYGRTLLQHVGTDIIRNQSQNYWVDFISGILKLFPNEWDCVLIPDCRFPNEVERLQEDGLEVVHIRVVRPNFVSPLSEEQQHHISETALDEYPCDYKVINDSTLDSLNCKVCKITDDVLDAP